MNWINVKRAFCSFEDTSSLLIKPGHLVVSGILPHGTQISFDAADRALLREWLDAQESNTLIDRIADALGTGERGEALVEVARDAHSAEQELAGMILDAFGSRKD